jgi:hypothetical protein
MTKDPNVTSPSPPPISDGEIAEVIEMHSG